MNKPVRAISIFCMFLFLALMANASYLQFWAADGYNDDPRNRRIIEAAFSRERGAILVGRDPIAESVPSDDEYKFQRTYNTPFSYAPITGFFSFYTQTGLEQTQNAVLSGEDPRLFVTRLVDMLSNDENQGGSVELTIDPDAQAAAYNGLAEIEGVEGSVVAIEPDTGKILAMVSLPSYDPNKLASHDLGSVGDVYDRLLADPSEPLINRATDKRLPPGSTFKLVTAAAAIENGLYEAGDDVPAGDHLRRAADQLRHRQRRPVGVRPRRDPVHDRDGELVQHHLRPDGQRRRRREDAGAGRGVRLQQRLPRGPAAGAVELPRGPQRAGDRPDRHRPVRGLRDPAADGDGGGRHRQRRCGDAPLPGQQGAVGRLPGPRADRAQRALGSRVTRRPPTTSPSCWSRPSRTAPPPPAAIPGVSVAGKTGTAQSGIESVPPYAWFVSFAPADDPQVAVAVMIESAPGVERGEIAGGLLGGPIAKAVMEAVLQ